MLLTSEKYQYWFEFGTDSSPMFNVLKHVSFLNLFLNTFYANTQTKTKIQIVNVGLQSLYMFLDILLVQFTD